MQDGNIHCHVDNLARRNGKGGERIAVATAAYNAGARLWSEREQRPVDFSYREDVIFSTLLLPEGAPAWAAAREVLWNRVDLSARRRDARLAKSIEAAVTRDIPVNRRPALLEAFVAPFVAMGCVADIAVHDDGTGGNPHVHVLLTTRLFSGDGFGDKITALEQRAFVKSVRKRWADLTNHILEETGSALRVDHRSYKARGIGAEPTRHRGPNAIERRRKREHARRIREEHLMEKDKDERPSHPAGRDPEPDHRDRDLELEQSLDEHPPTPEEAAQWDAAREQAHKEGHGPPAWWKRALENARQRETAQARTEFPVADPEQMADRAEYEQRLAIEAEREPLSEPERRMLDALSPEQEDMRGQLETLIHSRRIAALLARDEERLVRDLSGQMEPAQRAALDDYLASEARERDHDLPVPGPDGDLLSPGERDRAEDLMLQDYHREEEERERER
ncbi:MobA/MobL family protein [Rhizobium sp. PAMB 3174]